MSKKYLVIITIFIIVIFLEMLLLNKGQLSDEEDYTATIFSEEDILSDDVVILQNDNGFEPYEIEVKIGTRVVWLNKTSSFIWPASNIHPTHRLYSEFDPKEPFAPGEAWAFIFERTGDWKYHDHLKPYRQGIILVR